MMPIVRGNNFTNDLTHEVYNGETYVFERLIRPEKDIIVGDELLKKFSFTIKHDLNDVYDIKLTGVSIIDEANKTYNYDGLVSDVLSSSSQWTKQQKQDKIEQLKKELDIPEAELAIVQEEVISMDEELKDVELHQDLPNVSFADLIIPGNGYSKFLSEDKAKKRSIGYKALFLSTAGAATYFKIRENQLRRMFDATDISTNTYNDRANNNRLWFGLSAAVSGLVIVSHVVELKKAERRRDTFINSFGEVKSITSQYQPQLSLLSGSRLGLLLNF
jgi:hypothetical protein